MEDSPHRKEAYRRSLAVEGALILLIGDLATRGLISADEAEETLHLIAKSSDLSAARASSVITIVRQLRRLRRQDGTSAAGATWLQS